MFVNFIFCCIVENVECTFSLHFFWKKTFFKKSVSLRVSYQQHNMAFHKGRLGGEQIQILKRNGQPPQHQLIHPQGPHQGTELSQSFSEPAHLEALVLSSSAFLLPSCRSSELGLTD